MSTTSPTIRRKNLRVPNPSYNPTHRREETDGNGAYRIAWQILTRFAERLLVDHAQDLAVSMPALRGVDLVLSTEGQRAEAVAARIRAAPRPDQLGRPAPRPPR